MKSNEKMIKRVTKLQAKILLAYSADIIDGDDIDKALTSCRHLREAIEDCGSKLYDILSMYDIEA